MSTRLTIQDALKRVHLNTVTLKNEENERFLRALRDNIKPRDEITNFKEEVHEDHVRDFLLEAFYKGEHCIGKKDENNTDLCIFAENSEDSTAQVLIECKNPRKDNDEMINDDHLNRKGFHEVITYYLDELSRGNFEVKYLIVTNGYDWYIFEALMIRELIATNELIEKYKAFKAPAIKHPKIKTFYEQDVKPAVEKVLDKLVYTGFSLDNAEHSKGIRSICKMLSPYFLLKQSYNDKYALNERFYNELLYIIGLEEKKKNGRPVITRRENGRDPASLLENTLRQLSDFHKFISLDEESQMDLALELVLMWVNRMLFIKLVESQLLGFNDNESKYRFFTNANIKDYIRRSRATIDFRDFYTNYCFAPGKAIPAFDGINYEQTGGNLVTEKKIGYGTKYTVSYYNLNTDHENFQKYVTHPTKIEEKNWNRIQNQYSFADKLDFEDYEPYKEKMRTLYLPDTQLSDRAEAYMDELLDGSKSDYETLCRIENALSEMGYTWTPGEIPENVDSEEEYLDYFLFEKKEGYCVHFATAFVLMARSRGIPARMVQGFRVKVKSGATMSVKSDTGHAWAEAYLDGVGWLVFDATPGEQHGFYWMSAEERSQYSTGKNNEQNIPEEEQQSEEEDKPAKEKKPFDFRFVYIPLIAVAAFILIYVILDRIIRAAAFKKLPDEEKFLSVCRKNFRILGAAGYPMKEGETPAEFGKRVAKELKAEEYAFIKEYERVCYSDKGISDTALETALADRKALYELLRHTRGKGINYLLMKLSR